MIGDSQYSNFRYDIGSPSNPEWLLYTVRTEGRLCPSDEPTSCPYYTRPFPPTVSETTRRRRTNALGNMIEAYLPGQPAGLAFTADALWEEAEVTEEVDGDGNTHLRAHGTNRWHRTRLTDSEFTLSPSTPGTGVSPEVAVADGAGGYAAEMTMAETPQLNTVGYTSRHYPPLVPHLPNGSYDLDPTKVDENLQVTMVKDPDRPWLGSGEFSLWGVLPEITLVEPAPVLLAPDGTTRDATRVDFVVSPPEYAALLSGRKLHLELTLDGKKLFSASGSVDQPFTIPQALPMEAGDYEARIRLAGVSDGEDLLSEPVPVRVGVEIVFVDKRGQEVSAPMTSDAMPVLTLDPVSLADVTLLDDGSQALLTVSGEVTDPIADIVSGNVADIASVMIEGQEFPVTRIAESPTVTRPYAFKGRFTATATIPISGGENLVSVFATNALGGSASADVTIGVSQQVGPLESVSGPGGVARKSAEPFTVLAEPMLPDQVDSIVLGHGLSEEPPSSEPLEETGPATLTFAGTTQDLGQVVVRLDDPVAEGQPGVRRQATAHLSSYSLGIDNQELELVEESAETGVFRSPAGMLPGGEVVNILFDALPDDSLADHVTAKLGLPPQDSSGTLVETGVSSNVYEGSVDGLGDVRLQVWSLTPGSAVPGTLVVFIDSTILELENYLICLWETAPGSLEFSTAVMVPPSIEPEPEPAITTTTVDSVAVDSVPTESTFEPVWVVLKGATSVQPADHGEIDGMLMPLSLDPVPGRTVVSAASEKGSGQPTSGSRLYARFADPVVFVDDAASLDVPNVRPSPPDRAGAAEPLAPTHNLEAVSGGQSFRTVTGQIRLHQRGAIQGTKSKAQIWLSKRATKIEVGGE